MKTRSSNEMKAPVVLRGLRGIVAVLTLVSAMLLVPTPAFAAKIRLSYSWGENNMNVTGEDYDSIKDVNKKIASKDVGSNIWIRLDDHVETAEVGLILPDNKAVEIDLNGFKLDRNLNDAKTDGYVIKVGKHTKLTIKGGSHVDRSVSYTEWSDSGSMKVSGSNLGGIITGGYSSNTAGGIYALTGSTISLKDVTIVGCRAEQSWGSDGYGGGIWACGKNVTINMTDSTIRNCYSYNDGAGLYANYKFFTLVMKDSHIDSNYSRRYGGGIALNDKGGVVTGKGASTVSGNTSKERGGGIYVGASGPSIAGLTIENNRVEKGNGGGVALFGGAGLSTLTIRGNYAEKGGGVYVDSSGCTIGSCKIISNSSTGASTGGGVYVNAELGVSGASIIKDNGSTGNLMVRGSKTSFKPVNCSLTKNADVHVTFENVPTSDYPLSQSKTSDCSSNLVSDHSGYHFEFDKATRLIYFKSGSQPDKNPVPVTTVTASDAMTAQKTGMTENGYPVLKGYIRYPSFEKTSDDTASPFFYSDGYFVNADPSVYNTHLATCSLNMAMSGFYLNAGGSEDYTNKHAAARQFMASIGCQDQDIYINDFNVQKPGMASIGVTIAAKEFKDEEGWGTGKFLIPVAVRGAGYEAEWASNMTLGDATNAATGTEHQGFAEAANEVMKEIEYYLAKHNLNNPNYIKKLTFWVVGYSRAGATANLTSKRLVEKYGDSGAQVFGYTFEAPQGGTDRAQAKSANAYTCIHNIINYADLVPLVGPTAMGFKRYGVDHYAPGYDTGKVSTESIDIKRGGTSGVNTVTTYYDNEKYTTSHRDYPSARTTMLNQLPLVDPDLSFDDYFSIYRLKLTADVPPVEVVEGKHPDGKDRDAEVFIREFVEKLQEWSLDNRNVYAQQAQPVFRELAAMVFAMDPDRRSAFIDRINGIGSTVSFMQLMYALESLIVRPIFGRKIIVDNWVAIIEGVAIPGLKETGAWECLTESEQKIIQKNLKPLARILANAIYGDYKDYTLTHFISMVFNVGNIMSNHVPEINLAWLRSYDSYYDGENCAYVLSAPSSVDAPMAIAQKAGVQMMGKPERIDSYDETSQYSDVIKLKTDTDNDLCGAIHIDLGVKGIQGEAIYYKLTKDGASMVATPACANGYDVYRGGFDIDFSKDEGSEPSTYVITAYAVSFGQKSPEVTFTIKGHNDQHKLVVVNKPHGNEETFTVKEGTWRTASAVVSRGILFKTWKFTDQDGNDVSSKIPLGKNDTLTSGSINFYMPRSGDDGFKPGYSLRVEAVYYDLITSLTITNNTLSEDGAVDFSKLTYEGHTDELSVKGQPELMEFTYADVYGVYITTNEGYKDTNYLWYITLNEEDSNKLDRNVEVSMEGASDIQRTWNDDGTLTITGEFKSANATKLRPAKMIDVEILCCNAITLEALSGMEDPIVTTVAIGQDGLINLQPPQISGGAAFAGWRLFDGTWLEPVDDGVTTDHYSGLFRVHQKDQGAYILHALYKPVCTGIKVGIDAPVVGEELVTTATVEFVYDTNLFVFKDPFDKHTWEAKVDWFPGGESSLAQPDTNYHAYFESDFAGWVYEPISPNYLPVVVTGENADKVTYSTFNPQSGMGRINYNDGPVEHNHTVRVHDSYSGGDTQYSWQEGDLMEVVAQEDDNYMFDCWEITTNRDGEVVDVTRDVISDAYDRESEGNPTAGHPRLEIVMPYEETEPGSGLPQGYELYVEAKYRSKYDTVSVLIPEPGTTQKDISDKYWYDNDLFYPTSLASRFAMMTFSMPGGSCIDPTNPDSTNRRVGSVKWERDTTDGVTVGTTEVYRNTTYHMQAYIEPSLARYLRKDDIWVTLLDGDNYINPSWSWDDAGGLVITATYVTDDETGDEAPDSPTTFEVSVNTCDANDPERKQLEGVEVETYTFVQDMANVLYLSPTRVPGASFVGWEVPEDSGLELVEQPTDEPQGEGESSGGFSGTFEVVDTDKPLVARALYMPLVKSVTIGLAAPTAGADLPTANDVTVTTVLQNEAFSSVSLVAKSLKWNPKDDDTDDVAGGQQVEGDQQEKGTKEKQDGPQILNLLQNLVSPQVQDEKPEQATQQDAEDQDGTAAFNEFYYAYIVLDKEKEDQQFAFADECDISYVDPSQQQGSGDGQNQDGDEETDTTYMTYSYDNDEPPVDVHLYFEMTEKAKLVFVQDPFDIFDVANGTDLGSLLPPSTDIITTDSTVNTATIDWYETVLDYDGGDAEPSIWLATGTITLPDDIENPDNIDLDVAMEIYVNPPEYSTVYAEMPYATLESGEYASWQSIELGTTEEGGTIYYNTDVESDEFVEYQGEFIDLAPSTLNEEGLLVINAYTSVEGKANSPTAMFIYALADTVPVPEPRELTYNGEEQVGVWNDGGYTLTPVTDGVTIDEDGNACATVAGTYTVTAKLNDGYAWDMGYDEENDEPITSQEDQTITFTIAQEPMSYAVVDAVPDQPYTGSEVTPAPVVSIGDTVLVKDVDYTVTYENNTAAGTAKMIITGKDNFVDAIEVEFKIVTITITYDANGGEGTMDPQVVGPGIENPLANNAFTREDFEFNGWNDEPDGTGEAYHEGEPVAFDESVTLYAQWVRKTYVVAAFSRALDSDVSVADIQIDPREHPYEEDSEVTVTAPTKRGWAFVGWYPVTEVEGGLVKSYDDTQLSNKRSYTFTVDSKKMVVAIYEATTNVNATVRINSINAASYTIARDGKVDSTVQQGSSHNVPIGTKLTVTAKDPEKVVMWLNESDKVIGTGQTSLNYTVTSSTTISLVYSTGNNEQTQVKFISADDQVLLYRRYSADLADASAIEMPLPPTKLGNTFVRWVFEGTQNEATQETILAKVNSPSGNYAEVFVRPEYKASEEKAKVTLLTQKADEEPTESSVTEYQPGTAATLEAPAMEGMVFESWRDASGDVLGYASPLKLNAIGDQTITARYVPEGTEIKSEPVIAITGFNKLVEVDGRHRIQCLISRNVPSGYTLVEHGVLYGTDLGGLSEDKFVYGTEGVLRFVYKGKATNGAAYLTTTVSRDSTVMYYRAYMVLTKDGSSDLLTYYSDIRQTSYDAIGA